MFDKKYDVAKIMLDIKNQNTQIEHDYNNLEVEENDYFFQELSKRDQDLYHYRQVIEDKKRLGSKMPLLLRFNKIEKKILLLLTKIVYKASYLITREQNIVNEHLLLCIDRLTESVHLLKSARKSDLAYINKLETKINEQFSKISDLENEINTIEFKSIDSIQARIVELEKRIRFRDIYTFGGVPYIGFESIHRGDPKAIEKRLEMYLEYINNIGFSMENSSAVDIGCGKGDWLRVLKKAGAKGIGVDTDEYMVEFCKSENLEAIKTNGVTYLKSLKPDSVDIISGFHIIEHLDMTTLVELLTEAFRVLKQGGLLIFETPNSQNALIGLYNFYADPTHIKPIHFEWIKYVLKTKGYSEVVDILADSSLANERRIVDKTIVESEMNPEVISLLRKTNSIMNAPVNLGIVARKF